MALSVSKEGCGGVIDDNQGVLTAPGYPDKLLPHVKCRWDLKAGAGYRYLLEFEFTDPNRNVRGYLFPTNIYRVSTKFVTYLKREVRDPEPALWTCK